MISKHELIFQQWVSSLNSRDKSKKAIQGNFEELFFTLKSEGLTTETAYEFLGRAVKAHEPSVQVVKNVYKKLKGNGYSVLPEKDFQDAWCKDIADKANTAFFEAFPIETKPPEPVEQIVFGSMTMEEYKAQRRHAEQYPMLDLEEIEKRLRPENYNPVADLAAMLGKSSGDTD